MIQRPVSHVPGGVIIALLLGLALQLSFHFSSEQSQAVARPLPVPLNTDFYRLVSLNDSITAARVLDLWLQSFDTQAGISIPFNQLNYDRVILWLNSILVLDERDTYPMLVASNIYATVNDRQRVRKMLDFIEQRFDQAPALHWRWLAYAAITAKHKLGDLPLALKYANKLSSEAGDKIPFWAKDLRLVILEDMGQVETVKTLIGGLLSHGEIQDPYEINFLEHRLEDLKAKTGK